MKEIKLTKGYVASVDDDDFELVSCRKWSAQEVYPGKVYAHSGSGAMHRLILNAPKGVPVDHADGNGLNNQRVNIRLATWSENQFNRAQPRWKRGNSSGYKGVHWYPFGRKTGGLWECQICCSGARTHVGYFDDPHEAAMAYNEAALRLHGEFAFQNVLQVGIDA